MDEKRKPFEVEVPRHKKKSKKKGVKARADHKHEYKEVVLHSWWNNPFKNEMVEHMEVCEICTICGRVGNYITGMFLPIDTEKYDITKMEHWKKDDYFGEKFAKPLEE